MRKEAQFCSGMFVEVPLGFLSVTMHMMPYDAIFCGWMLLMKAVGWWSDVVFPQQHDIS